MAVPRTSHVNQSFPFSIFNGTISLTFCKGDVIFEAAFMFLYSFTGYKNMKNWVSKGAMSLLQGVKGDSVPLDNAARVKINLRV